MEAPVAQQVLTETTMHGYSVSTQMATLAIACQPTTAAIACPKEHHRMIKSTAHHQCHHHNRHHHQLLSTIYSQQNGDGRKRKHVLTDVHKPAVVDLSKIRNEFVDPKVDLRILNDDRVMDRLLDNEEKWALHHRRDYFVNNRQTYIKKYMRTMVAEWMLSVWLLYMTIIHLFVDSSYLFISVACAIYYLRSN